MYTKGELCLKDLWIFIIAFSQVHVEDYNSY